MGGITPCYSTVSTYLTPPPVAQASTVSISGSPVTVTSTIVNVVFARNYPVASSSGLDTGGKAGVGVGVSLAGLCSAGLLFFLLWRRRKRQRDRQVYPSEGSPELTTSSGLRP